MKVAVVGATGLVGSKMLRVLEERHFPVTELLPVASSRSWGKKVVFQGREWTVISAEEAISRKPAVAIFSAGGAASGELAPKFAAAGCRVVDNSSYWRMDPTKKLVVPEINGDVLGPDDYIIANPNCSTIQMVMALAPLHKAYGIKRIVVSTYQSVSGSGQKGVNQLKTERARRDGHREPRDRRSRGEMRSEHGAAARDRELRAPYRQDGSSRGVWRGGQLRIAGRARPA